MQKYAALILCLLTILFSGCSLATGSTPEPPAPTATTTAAAVPEPADEDDVTPTICPQATPEWLRVFPVTSPTSDLTQTIYVDINSGEGVSVTTPAGTFEARAESGSLEEPVFRYNYVVEIELLPDTEQELTVSTNIKRVERGGCPYGGYPLSTRVDINFEPLIIIQASE
jgi:hypothetical protein